MAIKQFNSVEGFSVGSTPNGVIDANANITAAALTANGNVSFTGANVSLGSNSNVKLTGGSSGQYLQTDGTGNLSWQAITVSTASISNGNSNVNIPAANGNIQVSVAGTANVITFTSNNAYRGSYGLTGAISQANTAPSSPQNGDQWYNTFNGILFEYLDDGTSSQWVDISSLPTPNIATVNASAVLNNVQTSGTYYPAFISSTANGNYQLNSNTAFSANLANGALIATTFVGALSGNATTAGTVVTAAQPNITSVGTLTSLGVNGNITAANITANTGVFTGNGSGLSAIAGANVTGTVSSATTAGTVTTAAQPNITSVGTLTSLGVAGAVTASTLTSNVATGTAPLTVTSTTRVANLNVAYANVSDFVGTGTAQNGNFNIALISGTSGNVQPLGNTAFIANASNGALYATTFVGSLSGAATTAGTVTTAAQPNITSVGTLSSLSVTANVAAGNLTTTGVLSVTGTGVSSIAGNLDMTSNTIINLATPTNSTDAATKQYVDDVAQGLHTHDSCNAATQTTLASISGGTVTYNNGTSGVGATLTTTGSYTTIDGVTLSNGMRILVKNEANAAHNGIYDRTSTTVLTRSTDFDTPTEMAGGDFTFITAGTLYDNTGWVMTDPVTTVGTTAVNWVQFSGAGTYTAGTGLTLTGSQFSVNASQSQITSVGTLTGLNSSGTITAPAFTANTGVFTGNGSGLSAIAGANVTGQVSFAATANAVAGANVSGTVSSATTAGTVTTAAQPNITSTGTLVNLAMSGTTAATFTDSTAGFSSVQILQAKNGTQVLGIGAGMGPGSFNSLVGSNDIVIVGSNTAAQGNANITITPWSTGSGGIRIVTVSNVTSSINLTATTTVLSGALQTANITTGANTTAGTVTGNWTLTAGSRWQATYADLAEKYAADATYEPGTVLLFGGEQEVTLSNAFDSTKVAGVVTTNPAYSMNAMLEAEYVAEIALQGRVPCKVQGPVEKGDLMVSASNGYATANNEARAGTIIGKALENFNGDFGIIEVAVGRF